MRRWLPAAVLTAILFACLASAWGAPESVSLELKGTPGQASRYDTRLEFSMDFKVQDPDSGAILFSLNPRFAGETVTVSHVMEVSKEGDLTLGGQIESFAFTLDVADIHAALALQGPDGGAPALLKLPPLPVQVVVSKRGKPLAIKGLELLPIPPVPTPGGGSINLPEMMGKLLADFGQPLYPDHAVKVGDSWESEIMIDVPALLATMEVPLPPEAPEQMKEMRFPVKGVSVLRGFEMMEGVECAKVESVWLWQVSTPLAQGVEGEAPLITESGETEVVTWLDHEAGQKVKETTETEFVMKMGQGQGTGVETRFHMSIESSLLK